MIIAEPGEVFEATATAPANLVGTIATQILLPDDTVAPGGDRTTAGITELVLAGGQHTGLYTVARAAPTDVGRYLLLWDTGTITPTTIATDEILVVVHGALPLDPSDAVPTVAEVATLLRARTKDLNGVEVGTFTSGTRPTEAQVTTLITVAAAAVADEVGATDVTALPAAARFVIALQTACAIEASYFPEQLKDDQSAYTQYDSLRREKMKALFPVMIA